MPWAKKTLNLINFTTAGTFWIISRYRHQHCSSGTTLLCSMTLTCRLLRVCWACWWLLWVTQRSKSNQPVTVQKNGTKNIVYRFCWHPFLGSLWGLIEASFQFMKWYIMFIIIIIIIIIILLTSYSHLYKISSSFSVSFTIWFDSILIVVA